MRITVDLNTGKLEIDTSVPKRTRGKAKRKSKARATVNTATAIKKKIGD